MKLNDFSEIKEFLKRCDLTNYEINAYLTLFKGEILTAREISKRSKVPSGRIYEILEELKEKGIIEIQDSRPKKYRIINPVSAFRSLISYYEKKLKENISFLTDHARSIENKLQSMNYPPDTKSTRIFWSTAFGAEQAFKLYIKKYNEAQVEILNTGFITDTTIKKLTVSKNYFKHLENAVKRGVQAKYLWSFQFDARSLSKNQIQRNVLVFNKIVDFFKKSLNLSNISEQFEMRFIHKRIPTLYDVFDKTRVLIKLQDPLDPTQIYSAINVLDYKLAEELRQKYQQLWTLEGIEPEII